LGDAQIAVLDRKTLDVVSAFGGRGSKPGEFNILHHLAVDSKGNIYPAEIGSNRPPQKFVFTGLTSR
jgi:hypothetical protein